MRSEECRFGPGGELAWDEYVSRAPDAGLYHRYGWARVIERTYGHRALYLWVRDRDRIRGILPLVLFRGALGGRTLVSLPFLDEGGLCADDEAARATLWEAAQAVARRERAAAVELRGRPASGLPLSPLSSKVTVMLSLADEPEILWKRLDAKVRNQVRKAVNSGLTPAWCGIEALDDFYDVFAQNMRDLGSPVHARRFFEAILEEFAGTARLLIIRDGPRAVAGGVCMTFRDTVLVPWASSLRQWRSRCPSNLLYWEAMRTACEKGLRWLDFGRSSPGGGTYKFKMQWGGGEQPLHWETSDRPSVLEADNPKYRLMIRAWRRLPVPVTRVIGPLVRGRVSN
jgi:FemAB-related protein (PEP-CTERM system-associated)